MSQPVRIEDYYGEKPALSFAWAKDIVFDALAMQQIVEDVLVAGGSSLWLGAYSSGKTTLLLDLALRMPRARPWLGKRMRRGGTLYVAAESPTSVDRRLEAYRRHHGDDAQDVGAFMRVPLALNLLDPSPDVEALLELAIGEFDRAPVPVQLIAIDTVARVTAGAKENVSEDMSRLIAAVDRIRAETGAHVALVHHFGKNAEAGSRGHSSLPAAVDTIVEVTFDEHTNLRTLLIDKDRDGGSRGMTLQARFRPVELGVDQWGKPITACVVEPVEPESAHLQAVMRDVENERAGAVVLAGVRRLVAMGVEPTDGATTHRYLPRQLLDKGLAGGFDRQALAGAMNRLMTAGKLRIADVGRYGNRGAKKGLVEVE